MIQIKLKEIMFVRQTIDEAETFFGFEFHRFRSSGFLHLGDEWVKPRRVDTPEHRRFLTLNQVLS